MTPSAQGDSDPLWYKDAVIYEVHVRAFFDSNGDGRGDFRGLAAKLDYLQDLGVTALWLLPFYPSPWRDDGYDVSSYTDIHPAYGSMRDFQLLLNEAHRRGMKIITELVLNHTSDQHPWFQRSRRAAPGSRWRDFYVWSDAPDKYLSARVIFRDFQASNWSYDPIAKAYYWHRFYAHQPDLNFDNPLVRRALFRIVDFWLDKGVDGFRLDAIPYLYEREGTSCENLPETHAYLKELRAHIDSKYQGRMLLAEANLWPEDAVTYYGAGDECQMSFHFPLMPRLFAAIRMEDRFPIVEILRQTPAIPENCQWALFLRNHDELTLEMVTDEERDYLYRSFAQDPDTRINLGIRRRLAPLLGNDRRLIELLNHLLFTMPGTPVTYYGDEIGMGDNVYLGDRNGVRTPMQWSADRNAGFSRANPQKMYLPVNIDPEYHYEAVNVEIQQNNAHSLLWWMKRTIGLRRKYKSLGRGTMEFLGSDNRKVLAFCRRYKDECIIVVANLSRFAQFTALSLGAFQGMALVEAFGGNEFPPVGDRAYNITLGPYACYWLLVQSRQSNEAIGGIAPGTPRRIDVPSLATAFDGRTRAALAPLLPAWLGTRRWFQGRGRRVDAIRFLDVIRLGAIPSWILLVQTEYREGDQEGYALFASLASGDEATRIREAHPDVAAFTLATPDGSEGLLFSGLSDPSFGTALLETMVRRRRFRADAGELAGSRTGALGEVNPPELPVTQFNNRLIYGRACILKLFRHLEPGLNPDVEIGTFLHEKAQFAHSPAVCGTLDYRPADGGEPTNLGVLHTYIQHETTAWNYTLDALGRFFEEISLNPAAETNRQALGSYLDTARRIGRRTAELHLALGSSASDPAFAPEPFSDPFRLALYHSMLNLLTRALEALSKRAPAGEGAAETQTILKAPEALRGRLRFLRSNRIDALKIRVHGTYHLGELLFTGKDFAIIDFEGDSRTRFEERRKKRSPLYDLAALLLSFRRAVTSVHSGGVPGIIVAPEQAELLGRWGEFWYREVSGACVDSYVETLRPAGILPSDEQTKGLLEVLLLEAALAGIERNSDSADQSILPELRTIASIMA